MLEHVKKDDEVVTSTKFRAPFENIIMDKPSASTDVMLERRYVEVEPVDCDAKSSLELPLHQTVPATDFGHATLHQIAIPQDLSGYVKSAPYPEMA